MRRPSLLLLIPLLAACSAGVTTSPSTRPSTFATGSAAATPSAHPMPTGLSNPGATWDPVSGMALFFGGDTPAGTANDLWGWDGSAWSLLHDGSGEAPSPRDDAQLVADAVRGVVVLVGGRTDRGGLRTVHNDTWEWDGSHWTERLADAATGAPPPRLHPVAGWDPASNRVLYAGGVFVDESNATDTWAWDGTRWEQLADAFPDRRDPPCRMVVDPMSGLPTVLAIDLDTQPSPGLYPTELWRWDGSAWETAASGGPPISPVQQLAATANGLLLADGGGLQRTFFTWTWDGATWTRHDGPSPPPRNGQAVVYDEARNRVVMTGGWLDSGFRTDLWEWDGAAWSEATPR